MLHNPRKDAERRRLFATTLPDDGWTHTEVAEHVGVTPSAVSKWAKARRAGGDAELAAKPHPGPKPKLDAKQLAKLEKMLLRGPAKHGYATELWTLPRIAEVIHKHFKVTYDPSGVWHLMNRLGWSAQKPEHQAREQDEQAVATWRKKDWPRLKKTRRSGKTLAFADESGLMLQPTVRRTRAPKGQTPILKSDDRHDRLSAISAVTLSPKNAFKNPHPL